MKHQIDPEGTRLPIKIDTTSSGEFSPMPLSATNIHGNTLAHQNATENARYRGIDRRSFLISSCGVASTLLAINQANAAAGKLGGFYQISKDAAFDTQLAAAEIEGKEFIFDVQGHFVNPNGARLQLVLHQPAQA